MADENVIEMTIERGGENPTIEMDATAAGQAAAAESAAQAAESAAQAAESVAEALQYKNEAEAAAESASAAYGTDLLAPDFNPATANDPGTYVIYSGGIYLLPNGHTAGAAWNNTIHTQVTVGGEVSALNSAISEYIPRDMFVSGDIGSSGQETSGSSRIRTLPIYINGSLSISTEGTNFQFVIYLYDENLTYKSIIDPWKRKYIVNAHGYIRLKFRDETKTSSNISDEIDDLQSSCIVQNLDSNNAIRSNFELGTVVSGGIYSDGTDANADKTRCRTPFIPVNGMMLLFMENSDYSFQVYFYNKNKEKMSLADAFVKYIAVNHTGYIRLKFRKDSASSSDISSDADTIAKSLKTDRVNDTSPVIDGINTNIDTKYKELKYTDNRFAVLNNAVCVSDTSKLSASAAETILDEETGTVYTVYLSSDSDHGYGERRQYIMLTKFKVANPNDREHFVVVKSGNTIGGTQILSPYEPNLIRIDNEILISFYAYDGQYYIRRFDMETNTLVDVIEKMKFSYSGNEYDFNDANMKTYYENNNLVFGGYAIFTCRHDYYNGYWYSAITSNETNGNALLCKSVDGIIWEIVGTLPGKAQYEEQIAFVGDDLFAVGRTDTKIYKSTDVGSTWTEYMTVTAFQTRPQLIGYKDSLLSIIPLTSNVEGYYGPSGRNTIGFNIDTNEKLKIGSRYGIVYPSVFVVYHDVFVIFSNNMLFRQYNNEAKDALFVARIGELYSDKEYEYQC